MHPEEEFFNECDRVCGLAKYYLVACMYENSRLQISVKISTEDHGDWSVMGREKTIVWGQEYISAGNKIDQDGWMGRYDVAS